MCNFFVSVCSIISVEYFLFFQANIQLPVAMITTLFSYWNLFIISCNKNILTVMWFVMKSQRKVRFFFSASIFTHFTKNSPDAPKLKKIVCLFKANNLLLLHFFLVACKLGIGFVLFDCKYRGWLVGWLLSEWSNWI